MKVAGWIETGLRSAVKTAKAKGLRPATKVAGTYPHPPDNIRIEQTLQPGDYVLGFNLPPDEMLNFHRRPSRFTAWAVQKISLGLNPFIEVGLQTDPEARTITVQTNDLGGDVWLYRIRAENDHGYVESKDFEIAWS